MNTLSLPSYRLPESYYLSPYSSLYRPYLGLYPELSFIWCDGIWDEACLCHNFFYIFSVEMLFHLLKHKLIFRLSAFMEPEVTGRKVTHLLNLASSAKQKTTRWSTQTKIRCLPRLRNLRRLRRSLRLWTRRLHHQDQHLTALEIALRFRRRNARNQYNLRHSSRCARKLRTRYQIFRSTCQRR